MSATQVITRDDYTIYQWATIGYLVVQQPIQYSAPRTFTLAPHWVIA